MCLWECFIVEPVLSACSYSFFVFQRFISFYYNENHSRTVPVILEIWAEWSIAYYKALRKVHNSQHFMKIKSHIAFFLSQNQFILKFVNIDLLNDCYIVSLFITRGSLVTVIIGKKGPMQFRTWLERLIGKQPLQDWTLIRYLKLECILSLDFVYLFKLFHLFFLI